MPVDTTPTTELIELAMFIVALPVANISAGLREQAESTLAAALNATP